MNIEIINKIDEITKIIDNDKDIKRIKELELKIESNEDLIRKINKLKSLEKYDSDYLETKKEILNNKDYNEYVRLNNELFLLIQEINKRLNSLKEKSGCI